MRGLPPSAAGGRGRRHGHLPRPRRRQRLHLVRAGVRDYEVELSKDLREYFTIKENVPSRDFSLLKALHLRIY